MYKKKTYDCECCGEKAKWIDNMFWDGATSYTADMFANILPIIKIKIIIIDIIKTV